MKNQLISVFLAACALLFSGCVHNPVGSTIPLPTPQTGGTDFTPAVTKVVVTNVVLPVLAKNPKYEPALIAIAAGIDVAMAGGDITPAGINAFLDTVALKYQLDPGTRLQIGSGLLDVLDLYHSTYGPQVASVTDPRVVKMLTALRDGINTGINRYHQLQP